MGPSNTKETRTTPEGDTNPRGWINNEMAQPDGVVAIDPDVNEWYKALCRDTFDGDGQEETSAQGNPVTNGQNYFYAGDNPNPSRGLNTEFIESDYFTVLEWFEEISRTTLAHRLGGQHVLEAYNPQMNCPQQLQPAQTPSWPAQNSQHVQPPHPLLWVKNRTGGRRTPPEAPSSSQTKRVSPKPTPGRRGGRSIPPAATDSRWTIWTLGNLDIPHINGGVTTKHLQKALFNTDGCKRTKLDYESLVDQVLSKRNEMASSMPEGWNSIQGWWVHINPGA